MTGILKENSLLFVIRTLANQFLKFIVFHCYNQPLAKPVSKVDSDLVQYSSLMFVFHVLMLLDEEPANTKDRSTRKVGSQAITTPS